jgi:hypothetical protein
MGRNKTKNGRSLNPADAFRKQQRQKEIKKNKIQKQKVRTLILQTKTSSKIQDQINEITRLEQGGDQDKKHKAKKKILQDTLAKVLELEKLKGDNLQEEDLMAIPNYIDFSQGTITLSDKPKERVYPPMPMPSMNGLPFMNGLPLPPQGPSPFDLPPPPDVPLPPDPYGALDQPSHDFQPPLPSDEPNDFQPPLPDGPAPLAPNFQPFPPIYYNQPNPNFPFGQPMPQGLAPFGTPLGSVNNLTPLPKSVTSTTTSAIPTASTITATTITSQPVLIAADEKKFIGVPSALRVKRVQSAMMPSSLTKKKARIDTVAAAIVSTYRPAVNPVAQQQQNVRDQIQAQQQQKEQEKLEEIEDDFEKYMDEMNALGVL